MLSSYIIARLQNSGIYAIYKTKGLSCGPLLDYSSVSVPLQLLATTKQHKNVAVISSNIAW